MKKVFVILGLFGLNLLYFNDTLSGGKLLVERDLTTFFYPFRYIWVETVGQGHFPFWNPYIKCGVPLFATLQPGVLYPLSLPYLFLPLDMVFNWTIIFHFFLAGAFTYMLMRELGATMQGAMAGALAFLFSGYLISVHNVLNTLLSVSWYPMVMFCGCRMVRQGGTRWAIATGASLCCTFLGGGIEIILYSLASLLLLCSYPRMLPLEGSEDSPPTYQRMGLLALSLIIFLGLSMIQLLPFAELYVHSNRFGGMPPELAMRWSLAPRDLFYFLVPDLYGARTSPDQYWEFQNYLKTIYVGPVSFFLAGIYFLKGGRFTSPLLAGMILALVFALGNYTPLYPLFYKYFPMFSTLRYPVKFLFLFIFYLCVTAGLGLDIIAQRFSETRRSPSWRLWLMVAAAAVLAGFLLVGRFYPDWVLGLALKRWMGILDATSLPNILHNFNRVIVVAILTLTVVFFGLHRKWTRVGSLLLISLLTLDLFLGNRGFTTKLDATKFHAKTEIIRTLNSDTDLFRFHVTPEITDVQVTLGNSYEDHHRVRKESLAADLIMEHHLFDIDGYNVPIHPRYERVKSLIRGRPLAACRTLLEILNVKYVLTDGAIDLPGFEFVQDGIGTSKLYENRTYLPRAFLLKHYMLRSSHQEFAQTFHDPNFNPRQTVLIEKEPARFLALKKVPKIPDLEPAVRVLTYENNRMLINVITPEAALLFMSETYYPGWKAYVDGKEEEILRANYTFRAIPVGPGSHRIEVVCQPMSFKVGLTLSLLTIAVILIGWAFSVRKRGV